MNAGCIYPIARQCPRRITNSVYERLDSTREIVLPKFTIFHDDTMVQTIAILVVSGSSPIITECIEKGVLRARKIIRRKTPVNECKTDELFTISAPRVAREISKVATRSQR